MFLDILMTLCENWCNTGHLHTFWSAENLRQLHRHLFKAQTGLAQDAVRIHSLIPVLLLTHRRCGTVSVPSGSLQVQENRSQLHQSPAGVLSGRPVQPNCADCGSRRRHLCCPGSRRQEQRKLSQFHSTLRTSGWLTSSFLNTKPQTNPLVAACSCSLQKASVLLGNSQDLQTKYEIIRLFLPA